MAGRRPFFVQRVRETHRDRKVEVWLQDESRVGQQGTLTHVWAQRGSRPQRIRQTAYKWGYLFGAVNPQTGASSALISPTVSTALMSDHLRMICEEAGEDRHVVLVLDGAGWHHSKSLVVPKDMTLLFLPPYSPELNAIERLWAYLKSHYLSNRVYSDEAEIDAALREAWNALDPERIKSVTSTAWIADLD